MVQHPQKTRNPGHANHVLKTQLCKVLHLILAIRELNLLIERFAFLVFLKNAPAGISHQGGRPQVPRRGLGEGCIIYKEMYKVNGVQSKYMFD